MDDAELKEKIKEVITEMQISGGHRAMTVDELVAIQPGLGRIMPEIGNRTWKLYYAAEAGNWDLANFEWKEINGLMELGAFTRPKHEEALNEYTANVWPAIGEAIKKKDFAAFKTAFENAIEQANAYHELKEKPYIRWELPKSPPPELDLKPRGPQK